MSYQRNILVRLFDADSEKEEKPQQENQDYNAEPELQKMTQGEEPKEKERLY